MQDADKKASMKYFMILFMLLFCLSTASLQAQGITAVEHAYDQLQADIAREQSRLDSLNALLASQAAKIDATKKSAAPDENTIREMMAAGLEISRQIESAQRTQTQLNTRAANQRHLLAEQYSTIIDSLRRLENSGNYQGDRQRLQQQISGYTEKFILFSPAFQALSFDPRKIGGIYFEEIEDSLEREIALSYLQNALSDVDSHLVHIRRNSDAVYATIRLEEKTREFLEEVDDPSFGLLSGASENISATANFESQDGRTTTGDETALDVAATPVSGFSKQLENISLFIRQLDIDDPDNLLTHWQNRSDGSLTLEMYLNLLKDAEKRLETYAKTISRKLETAGQKR